MDKNQGYAILKAVMLENGRGFALGEHPTAPSRYVTWACYDDKDGQRQYEWGHYGNDRTAMEQDFTDRVQDYQRIYNVGIRQTEAPGLYKYYSTQRPVDIGTFPKPPYNKPDEIFNYDQRVPVENGSFLACVSPPNRGRRSINLRRRFTVKLTTQELEQMRSVDIGAVAAESLPDVSGMTFDNALSRKERISRFLQTVKNPYCFCIGGVGVKIEFAESGPSLQDKLTDFLLRQRSGL